MRNIGPNCYIDPKSKIAEDVIIGPNCYIGPDVVIDSGCKLHNNVTIIGPTKIGKNNQFYPNAVIGADPQDLKYKGSQTELIIGDNNIFRESVTIHRGTELGDKKTEIGNNNLFMAGVHIAHDCIIEDHVILANNVLVAGHVHIERGAVVGGGAGIHHFVTIGRHAMIGGLTRVISDVPPFMLFGGTPPKVRGINTRGLRRSGYTEEDINALRRVYRILFKEKKGQMALIIKQLEEDNEANTPSIKYLLEFLKRRGKAKFGRFREGFRTDTIEDIIGFYKDEII